jgi:hypothetical protein
MMRLAHEAHVAEAEIAETSMDELRGSARGRAAEVARVDERDREACAGGVSRDSGADDPAADDEQVEATLDELVECPPAR